MIVDPPIMTDAHDEYYMFVPMLATLYGRDAYPHHFLRVVPGNNIRETLSFYDNPTDPTTQVLVETVDMRSFLEFVSYGYTPYAECAMSGLPNGIDFAKYSEYLLSQATIRNYVQRCAVLLDICDSKKLSLMTRFASSPVTSELIDELEGALCSWELFMNTGRLSPKACLNFAPGRKTYVDIPYKKFQSKYDELCDRVDLMDFAKLEYKITPDKRTKLLNSFSD